MTDKMDIALNAHRMIAPLLAPGLEKAEISSRREQILLSEGISERTLRRMMKKFRDGKLDALKPKERSDKGDGRSITDEVLAEAIALKEELPTRSIRRIAEILEKEGVVEANELATSTLSRRFRNMGLTSKALKLRKDKGMGSKRFQKEHKGSLFQTDIKYGPFITDPENPKKTCRTYLLIFLDDATRIVLHGEFYLHQRLPILEDCFRKAILSWGLCNTVYLDNGKIFVSKWFKAACANLGIYHLPTASYSPQSKGKVERFNRTVEEFFEEIKLENISTLKELNQKFQLWLQESYHKRSHKGLALKEGTNMHLSPMEAWEMDTSELRSITPEECKAAFLWCEERKVDKTGCFTIHGITFEAGLSFIGQKIEVRFDPFDLTVAEVWTDGEIKTLAKCLEVKEFNGIKRKKNAIEVAKKTGSRLLKGLESQKKERTAKRQGIISYKALAQKDGDSNC